MHNDLCRRCLHRKIPVGAYPSAVAPDATLIRDGLTHVGAGAKSARKGPSKLVTQIGVNCTRSQQGQRSGITLGITVVAHAASATLTATPLHPLPVHQGRHAVCACLAMGATTTMAECRHASVSHAPLAPTQASLWDEHPDSTSVDSFLKMKVRGLGILVAHRC